MLSMLIGEHVVGCVACVESPDVRLSALQLGWESKFIFVGRTSLANAIPADLLLVKGNIGHLKCYSNIYF